MGGTGRIDGHSRERKRFRFLVDGLDGFEDRHVIELLLFYAIPRADMNRISHESMRRHFHDRTALFSKTPPGMRQNHTR